MVREVKNNPVENTMII